MLMVLRKLKVLALESVCVLRYRPRSKPNAIDHLPKGQTVRYVRVSSFEQNESRQLKGLALDRVFTDKASGKNIQRPQLEALMKFVQKGDVAVCHSMDRLGHNLVDLRKTVG